MKLPDITPGPWENRSDDDRYEADTVPIYAGRQQVCDVYGFETEQQPDMTIAEAEANAKAIAAVPALLEALAGIEDRVSYATKMYHDATRWSSEDAPEGDGSLRDWVFGEVNAALRLAGASE